MSEEKQPKPLTPEQQAAEVQQEQQTDEKQIHGRFAATDMMERASDLVDGIFGRGPGVSLFGTTNFENAPLNAMLDLLDSANPADLENAGESLEKARTALNEAAKELAASVASIDWKGEGAESFRAYGAELVTYTYGLGTFANAVGAQMKVASTGLTSVRNSKPPRDSRAVQKKPDDFALPERTQDNPEYRKALEVEKDRQEAINQMNRLASFYAVSATTLASQDPPPMPKPVNAAVPMPSGQREVSDNFSAAAAGQAGPSQAPSVTAGPSASGIGTDAGSPSRTQLDAKPGPPVGSSPSMEIDSVTTPVAPAPSSGPTPPPSLPQTSGPVTGTAPPVMTNFGNPQRSRAPQVAGPKGSPRAGGGPGLGPVGRPSATGSAGPSQAGRAPGAGRPAPTGGPAASAGRSGATAGRPGPMGTGTGAGRPGVVGGTGQSPVAGRPGMPGQPVAGRPGSASTPRTGHSNGIVGGTPQRTTNGATGARLPRATVIGAEGATTGRSSIGRPSQAGVIGPNQGAGGSRPTGRGTPSVNGVVGTARGAVTGSAGRPLAGGRGGQGQPRDEDRERTRTNRPDYLTEDEETWAAKRRGAVPPVID
ncbi:hypothetical protein [Streptomyces lavendofoliae]|uniref:hypothetical protein n=1 Tax=Streptomyces lavendofoliae TaxID=67314 RepID=UPI00300F2038